MPDSWIQDASVEVCGRTFWHAWLVQSSRTRPITARLAPAGPFPRAPVVSTVLLLTTYLARSLYAEPFGAGFSRGEAAYGVRELVPAFPRVPVVSTVLFLTTYLARSLYAEPSANSPLPRGRITCPRVSPLYEFRRDVPKPARGGADASGASNAQPRVRTIETPASPTGWP
jgi:hypothetical protein